jgi:hypothetical protein
MKIRITDLPANVGEDDIRELLDNSDDIEEIELIDQDDSDNPMVIVSFKDKAAAEGAVNLINGRTWKGATLRADKMLY